MEIPAANVAGRALSSNGDPLGGHLCARPEPAIRRQPFADGVVGHVINPSLYARKVDGSRKGKRLLGGGRRIAMITAAAANKN
jgi:hypothetical protein